MSFNKSFAIVFIASLIISNWILSSEAAYWYPADSPTVTKYYVSSSTGNDANNGLSPATAVRTINRGLHLVCPNWDLNNCSPTDDWLLLKNGDIFITNNPGEFMGGTLHMRIPGLSADHPFVMGTYDSAGVPFGPGPRPTLKTGQSTGILWFGSPSNLSNILITGWKIYADARDPLSPTYTGPETLQSGGLYGISFINNSASNVKLQDLDISYYQSGIVIEGNSDQGHNYRDITINNNYLHNMNARCYPGHPPEIPSNCIYSQAIYTAGMIGTLDIVDNVFKDNGFLDGIPNYARNYYSHNLYVHQNSNVFVRVLRNIGFRGDAFQLRNGGIFDNNFVYGFTTAATVNGLHPGQTLDNPAVITNNVVQNGADYPPDSYTPQAQGWGLELGAYAGDATIANNLVIHNKDSAAAMWAFSVAGKAPGNSHGTRTVTIQNNSVFNWTAPGSTPRSFNINANAAGDHMILRNNFIQDPRGQSYPISLDGDLNRIEVSNNHYYSRLNPNWWFLVNNAGMNFASWVNQTGEEGATDQYTPLVSPRRGVEMYMYSLGYPAEMTAEAFTLRAAQNRPGNYDERFTAAAINDYIRAGYRPMQN